MIQIFTEIMTAAKKWNWRKNVPFHSAGQSHIMVINNLGAAATKSR